MIPPIAESCSIADQPILCCLMAGAGYMCVVIPYLPAQSRGGVTTYPQPAILIRTRNLEYTEIMKYFTGGTGTLCRVRGMYKTHRIIL